MGDYSPRSQEHSSRGHSYLASPGATQAVMSKWGLHNKKALGQHFLVDDNVISKIIELGDVQPQDRVLEVGPGIGTLTVALMAAGAQVVAVERDADLIPVLDTTAGEMARDGQGAFELLNMDALDISSEALAEPCSNFPYPGMPTKLISNLPYAVAATVVLGVMQRVDSIDSATVMVQSEVADRMSAHPGEKDYGAYSVKLQLIARPVDTFKVSSQSFMPPPRVDSKVIRLDRRDVSDPDRAIIDAASLMADAAFAQRRKTIRNSMVSFLAPRGVDKLEVDQILQSAGVDPKSRGEQHPLDDFIRMGRAYLSR